MAARNELNGGRISQTRRLVLTGWCWVAAAVLIVSLVVHVSTFVGIDPMAKWPGVMAIHFAIFPPFFAALWYAQRIGGKDHRSHDRVANSAPRWLRILAAVCFAYALVNFGVFMVLNEGGSPHERNGKYVLQSHGRVLRELSEAEYHRHQAHVVRGFSGHWMLFSSAALMILVGAARLSHRSARQRAALVLSPTEHPGAPGVTVALVAEARHREAEDPLPEQDTVKAGLLSLLLYVLCLAMILSGQPALSLAAVPPVTLAMVLAIRRRRGFPLRHFESTIGCLTVFPNALIASRMGWRVAELIYLAVYIGVGPALSHQVAVTFPKEGPSQLSNGALLDNRVWAALMLLIMFPLFVVGTIGLTNLAEHVGRLVELRRGGNKSLTGP
jgi:hypothetical protein